VKALTLNGYEALASLKLAEVAVPEPGPNDVLVQVRAASVNPVDGKITRCDAGTSRPLPHMLGCDCMGVIVKTGSTVTAWNTGDEINGVADAPRYGTHTEFRVMPTAQATSK
jgi:NADPH:quinone reductase-like Zn-dependent oxidoreductase